jgi:hypothetical protein
MRTNGANIVRNIAIEGEADSAFNVWLKQYRRALDLAQEDLAERMGPTSPCHSRGRRGTDDGNKYSSGFDHLPGALQGVAANHNEDHINTVYYLLDARGGVVDGLVGPRFVQDVAIARRAGSGDLRPSPMSKLDSKDSTAPAPPRIRTFCPAARYALSKRACQSDLRLGRAVKLSGCYCT